MSELSAESKLDVINDVVCRLRQDLADARGDDAETEFLRLLLTTAIVSVCTVPLQ
jgi:hypothetical protein